MKCIVCRKQTFYTDPDGWCLQCVKSVRRLDASSLKSSGFEIPDTKTITTSITKSISTNETTKSTTESNGSPNGVSDKPQTRIFTDRNEKDESLLTSDDDTEDMDTNPYPYGCCPVCRNNLDKIEMEWAQMKLDKMIKDGIWGWHNMEEDDVSSL